MKLPKNWPDLIEEAYEARAYFQRRYQRRKIVAVLVCGIALSLVCFYRDGVF